MQETRRSEYSAFIQADYLVDSSGECGGENGENIGKIRLELALESSLTRAAQPPELIRYHSMKVTFELRGRVNIFCGV